MTSSRPKNNWHVPSRLLIAFGIATAAALAITACTSTPTQTPVSSTAPPSGATPSNDTTAGGKTGSATLRGLDKARVQETFQALAKELLVPGAAMMLRTTQGDINLTYGVTSAGGTTPVSLDDHIRIGSITKTWTGTVILQLVQEGKLKLEDPVSKYRPDVPNGDNITIEQLLTMRSGIYNYSESYELSKALDTTPQRVWTPEELVAIALPLPVYFGPGKGFHYSNTNTVLLGLIAEKLDGKGFGQIVRDRILGPLDLNQTSFPASDSSALPEPFSRGYMYMDNLLTLSTTKLPADLIANAQDGLLKPNDYTNANPSWTWAAGQGVSTAGDLVTMAEGLTDGKLLNPDLQKKRMDSLVPVDADNAGAALYGMALAQFGPLYGHTGELPGYNTFMGRDPQNKVTLVVWTNLAPAPDGRDPASTIAKAIIGDLYGAAPSGPATRSTSDTAPPG
ncbi:serine hydrolase domain-containing protein [Burkholderia sp. RS01]|uniref:serine hydrolase domain-containing protein n=1 Tax=unclassified Burkholderia TaxID=2613784 RepID=UPI0032181BB1